MVCWRRWGSASYTNLYFSVCPKSATMTILFKIQKTLFRRFIFVLKCSCHTNFKSIYLKKKRGGGIQRVFTKSAKARLLINIRQGMHSFKQSVVNTCIKLISIKKKKRKKKKNVKTLHLILVSI